MLSRLFTPTLAKLYLGLFSICPMIVGCTSGSGGGGGGGSTAQPGELGGPCYGNGTCNTGLSCNETSNTCEAESGQGESSFTGPMQVVSATCDPQIPDGTVLTFQVTVEGNTITLSYQGYSGSASMDAGGSFSFERYPAGQRDPDCGSMFQDVEGTLNQSGNPRTLDLQIVQYDDCCTFEYSGTFTEDGGGEGEDEIAIDQPPGSETLAVAQRATEAFADSLATVGKQQAIDDTITLLQSDPQVEEATISSDEHTIIIEFVDGHVGYILTETMDDPDLLTSDALKPILGPAQAKSTTVSSCKKASKQGPDRCGLAAVSKTLPGSRRAAVYQPYNDHWLASPSGHTSDRLVYDVEAITDGLEPAGYTVDHWENESADLEVLLNVLEGGYGVIVMQTHGFVGRNDYVAVLTRGEYNLDEWAALPDEIRPGVAFAGFGNEPGKFYYTVDASVVDQFSYKSSLVWVGACLSINNESMARAFVDNGAGVYFGFTEIHSCLLDTALANRFFQEITVGAEVSALDAYTAAVTDAYLPEYDHTPEFFEWLAHHLGYYPVDAPGDFFITASDSVAIADVTPTPGTTLTAGLAQTFTADLSYTLDSLDDAVLELSVYGQTAEGVGGRRADTQMNVSRGSGSQSLDLTYDVEQDMVRLWVKACLRVDDYTILECVDSEDYAVEGQCDGRFCTGDADCCPGYICTADNYCAIDDSDSEEEGEEAGQPDIAYYPFDGSANDATGNGNDGTEHGGTSYVAGVNGQAIQLDGETGYVDLTEATNLDGFGAFTISVWLKPAVEMNSSTGRQVILYKGRPSQNVTSYELGYDAYDGQLHFTAISAADWFSNGSVGYLTELPAQEWLHVACTYDGASVVRMYVDGQEAGSVFEEGSGMAGSLFDNSDPLTVGRRPDGQYYFNGSLDELRVYNRALSASEVRSLYEAG